MQRLAEFEVVTPATVGEAVATLASEPGAVVIAGGTDLVPKMKRRQMSPPLLVSLGRVEGLAGVAEDDAGLRLGASTTLRALERDRHLDALGALREAVRQVATPIIRNTATLGGNLLQDTRCRFYDRSLFWRDAVGYCIKKDGHECRVAPGGNRCFATFCSDLAPALAVVDARATLCGGDGERSVAIEDLYRDDGANHVVARGEILTDVAVASGTGFRSTYRKLRMRDAFDFPEVGVAAAVREEDGGVRVNVAVTGIAPRVVVSRSVVARDDVKDVPEAVYRAIKPVDTMSFPPGYRKTMARRLLARCLDELLADR